MITLSEYKAEFAERKGIHFNNAGLAPLSKRVARSALQVVISLSQQASFMDAVFLPEIKRVRDQLASLVGMHGSDVAFFSNCGSALSQVAFGMRLSSSDQVLVLDQEYASNYYPWKVACERSGAQFVTIPSQTNRQIDLEQILKKIVPGVKVVACSWVQFQTGTILDLKAIGERCREVGARFVVDVIQGLGQMPFTFQEYPVDAIVGGAHKWMCSLNGQAFLILKKDFADELDPLLVGAGTFNRFGTYGTPDANMETSARKFEAGGQSYASLLALGEAANLIAEVGASSLAAEIARLSRKFREGLKRISGLSLFTPFEQAGGITSFTLPSEKQIQFLATCFDQKIALVKRGDFVRASLHAFNTDDEIEIVLGILKRL